jgi:transcriptional regulator with XRE-family HTH domain
MVFQLSAVRFSLDTGRRKMKDTFGARLRALREAKALTLPQLSKRSRLGVATLFRYERMAAPGAVAYDALVRLSDALEVDARYLTGEDRSLVALEASEVAARESLKRFLERMPAAGRLRHGFCRIQDDPAAPRSVRQWDNFARLLGQVIGQNDPKPRVESARGRQREKKVVVQALHSRRTENTEPDARGGR